MKQLAIALFFLLLFLNPFAQVAPVVTSADMYLGLRKLNVLGSVLYVAAHPDDENTRLLAYLSKERLYRTGYLSLTRGDGGQNLIGNEQGVELGLIRTQELLSARRIDGAEQFFTRAYDFGFSKNPEETFTKWNKEKILSDVVWVIRKFRPDVIITRFPTTGEGGHGHHTASAILANEAFTAAADPKRFPEQLKYVQPWKAKRILWNTFNFGGNNTTRDDQFKMDVGAYNAVLGKSYGEVAAESRSQHKSQGFGVARSRGEAIEFFSTTGGDAPVTDLMDGITTSWQKVTGADRIQKLVDQAVQSFDFVQPQKSVPQLVQIYKAVKALPDCYWKEEKQREIKKLIERASGIWAEATAAAQNIAQGDSARINFGINNRGGANMKLQKIKMDGFDSSFAAALQPNKNLVFSKTILVKKDKAISQPYWLNDKMEEAMFFVPDQQLIGQPDITPAFTVQFDAEIEGEAFTFEKPVQYKYTDPVKGELYQPVFVIPAVTMFTTPEVLVFRKDAKQQKELNVQLNAHKNINGTAEIAARSRSFSLTQKDSAFTLAKNASRQYNFSLDGTKLGPGTDFLQAFATYHNDEEQAAYLSMAGIHYDHIPTIRYFYSDGIKLLNINLATVGKKIGYIVGAGDKVPEALEEMGYEVTMLGDKELQRNNLQQFDAIISGVRAYNTAEWLNNHYNKLMQYVANGGNLIVQYNTSNQIGPVKAKIGPYNFNISRNRVTDETAPVTFLKPGHSVLNYPNKITQDDFSGWVQERSIYHATEWDKAFESIFSMHDKGEQPDSGSLIIAKHGKGYFTYTGLVFFRELPAGVPGAYRLLANLIALNKRKEF
jgi:LmbE family N-acetylglucosaminyl deacetylase